MRQQNADVRNDYFNDRIESMKVYGNCQWLLYQNINFEGQSYILNPGNYPSPKNWGGIANHISSARALPRKGKQAIVLFQHSNYRGRMLVLEGTTNNLPAIDFNDQLSSFIITGGSWTIFEHINCKGKHATVGPGQYSSAPSLLDNTCRNKITANDKISSVRKN